MEEAQKKTQKVSNTKKHTETSKPSTTSKKTKPSDAKKRSKAKKTTTTAKSTKVSKTSNAKKTIKTSKTSATKNDSKTVKTSTNKKEAKVSSTNTTKKQNELPETSNTKKDNIPLKPSNKKTQASSKKKSDIIEEQAKENKVKEEQKDKVKKKKRQYIDISIGAILCTIIIVALLILNIRLGVRAYNIVTKNNNTDYVNETQNNISVTQEVGNVLDRNNELVEQMKEKITFAPNVIASIYNAEPFSTSTIPNDLKLRLGWSKVKNEDKLKSINEKNEEVEAIEKDTMEESIKNILGHQVKCKHEDFENTNISTFSTYAQNKGTIYYSDALYKSIGNTNIEDGIAPLIYQEIEKVVKYNEKVIVYVKVAYMDTDENKYVVYKDFNDNKFEEKLSELTPEELFGDIALNKYNGEGTVSANPNSALDSIRDQLDTYKYTFTLEQQTGKYYLSKFNKALSIQ